MYLTYRHRLLPTKRQHLALAVILESQRELYNAALEERIDAYRKAKITRTYFDQAKALTAWRHSDDDATRVPHNVQRATLKRVDHAHDGFFRRVEARANPGFPRFRVRTHDCPHCGLSIDRDLNAARNILYRAGRGPGLRNVAELGMRAGGNLRSPTRRCQERSRPYGDLPNGKILG